MKGKSRAAIRFPAGALTRRETEICHNLRPPLRRTGLEAVCPPAEIPLGLPMPGLRLLPGGRIDSPDGRKWLAMEHEGRLVCHDGTRSVMLPDAPGRPSGIVTCAGRYLVLMGADEAPMWLQADTDDGWTWHSAADMPEPFALVRNDESPLSVTVGGVELRGAYTSRSTLLSAADTRTVGRLVGDAYRSIAESAVQRQVYFQPVIARYSLVGHNGELLYVSAPVMVMPPDGQQLLGVDFLLGGTGFSTISVERMTASAFTLRLKPCIPLSGQWLETVSRVVLSVSPQLHPFDGTDNAPHRFGSFSATSGSLHVGLPGLNDVVSALGGEGSRLRSLTEAVLASLSESLRPCATFGFDSSACEWQGISRPVRTPSPGLDAELSDLRRLQAVSHTPLGQDESVMASVDIPHCLCAGVADTGGDSIAYAGVSATRFRGWLPCGFVIANPSPGDDFPEAVPVAVKIVFADGSSCVRSATVSSFRLGALSPLLTYPSADAVRMELFYERYFLRVELRPDPSGRFAYWLSDDGLPVVMIRDRPAFILPAGASRQRPLPSTVVLASVSQPLRPLALTQTSESRPVALMAVSGSTGGWDAGSARFYLFGKNGVQSVTANSTRSRLTARTLDTRVVGSRDSVCSLGGNSVAVLAGDDLVRITGQSVVTLRSFVCAERLARDAVRNELICFYGHEKPCPENFMLAEGDNLSPLFPDAVVHDYKGRMLYSRSFPSLSSLLDDGQCIWATDDGGRLYNLSASRTDAYVDIAYRSSVASPSSTPGIYGFEIPVFGEITGGTVEIRADNGAGVTRSNLLTSLGLSGEVVHLPPLSVFACHSHNFILSINLRGRLIRISYCNDTTRYTS